MLAILVSTVLSLLLVLEVKSWIRFRAHCLQKQLRLLFVHRLRSSHSPIDIRKTIWLNWNNKFCLLPKYLLVIWEDNLGILTLLVKKYGCNLIIRPWDLSSARFKIFSLSSCDNLRIYVSILFSLSSRDKGCLLRDRLYSSHCHFYLLLSISAQWRHL